ncbi:kinesin [Angomonas deanei]|nr:kinesin [Angomonas deanei]|eukprot:EPY40524.1 kinesin [Angomonas deanei]
MLELKDELLLEKSAMAQYMARMSARLISQMETLGLTPCCSLPQSCEELANEELGNFGVQGEKQQELEERLKKEQEEKERMSRLLKAFDEERQVQSAVLNAAEIRNKELEERDSRATETIHRLAEKKTQKEKVLEEAARRATRELMEAQAKLAQREAERKVGVFERLFGRS